MTRVAALLAVLSAFTLLSSSPALAISEFGKQWKNHYLGEGADAAFVKAGRKAGCYVCHVKGKEKKEARNEYGEAINKFLNGKDFPKEYIKENPEEAKKKILEGFKKAAELKSKDEQKFGEKIKANKLPAVDSGLPETP